MCGIAGIVLTPGERVDPDRIRAMTDALAHRGPDADGLLVDGNVSLGHRRLTILDLSAAADQPLASADGELHVIFNGEIYNFHALRRELAGAGHAFRTRTDTEVLLHGWRQWGEGLVRRLRGMFAFALYDRRRRRLFLARDPIGKKPLYLRALPGSLAFASEIKALTTLPELSGDLDLTALGQFMTCGNVDGERSIYREIRRLPPGSTLSLDVDRSPLAPEIGRFWRFEPRPDPRLDAGAFLEELEATLAESVRLRLLSDVPLGAFLSGGIDSSLIVALMAREGGARVKTFAIGFTDKGWDESPYARAVADYLGSRGPQGADGGAHDGIEHREEIITPDAAGILPELVEVYDEPFADPSAIPTWYLSRLARRHVKVALSGDGGDELFFGYRRYWESEMLRRAGVLATPLGRAGARLAARAFPVGSFPARALDRLSRLGSDGGFGLYHHAHGFAPEYLSLLGPEARFALGPGEDQPAARDFHRGDGLASATGRGELSFLDRARLMDMDHYLPDQILVKVDRAAMRHSLEVRCPLLDLEVMELAARAPASLQITGREQKILLRRLAFRHVPRELLDRPKQGFAVPLGRWFRGELAPTFREALADTGSPAWRYLDRAAAARRFEAHLSGKASCETALWRLLFFHAWARRFRD